MVAPAVNGFLEAADHRETQGREARRQPVDHRPGTGRRRLQGRTGRLVMRVPAALPVARHEFAHAVEDRPRRAKTEGGQHRVPGQHAKHMTVRRQHRILDHVPHDLAARQLGGIDLLPLRQQRPGPRFVALVERVADVGEVVAELPEPQRHVQHRHAPQHRERPAQRPQQQPVNGQRRQRRQHGRQRPGDPAVVRLAGIEVAAHPARPAPQAGVNRVAARQRTGLLDQQGKQDGEKTHGRIITSGDDVPPPSPAAQADRNR